MRKYLMMFILALTVVSFSTAANAAIGATYSPNMVGTLPQENYGANSNDRQRSNYNNAIREANRNSQRHYDQQAIYNQNQQIINQLNQQEKCCKQSECNK